MLRRALILLALSFLLGQSTIKGCTRDTGFLMVFCMLWHSTGKSFMLTPSGGRTN